METQNKEKMILDKCSAKVVMKYIKMIVLVLNIHFFVQFKVEGTGLTAQNQPLKIGNPDESCQRKEIYYEIVDCQRLTEKQFKFMNLLCYKIINDIALLIESSNLSVNFKLRYEITEGYIAKYLGAKPHYWTKTQLEENTIKAIETYFRIGEIKDLSDIIIEDFKALVDQIKSINVTLEYVKTIISTLEYYNGGSYDSETDKLTKFINFNITYISELDKVFKKETSNFIESIREIKILNCGKLDKFKSETSEKYVCYNNMLWSILVKYEEKIQKLKLNIFLPKIKPIQENNCDFFINKCISKLILWCPKIYVSLISQAISFIAKNRNEVILDLSNNIPDDFSYRLKLIKDKLYKASELIKSSIENKNEISDDPFNFWSFFKSFNFFENKLIFEPNLEKTKNIGESEIKNFNMALVELFKLNIRNLIILKIIIESLEYFGIYLFEHQKTDNLSPFEVLSNETLQDCYKRLKNLNEKIEKEGEVEKLTTEEENTMLHYFLYQKLIMYHYDSKKGHFNNLFKITTIFKNIENQVLLFYIDNLVDNIVDEDQKISFKNKLLFEYEEEYLKLANIFDKDYKYLFFRLPMKLKKLVN